MATDQRWIRVGVDIFQHPVFDDREPMSKREAWIWLVAQAAPRRKRAKTRDKIVALERGQLLGGRDYLAKTWRWTPQKVRSYLTRLQREGMIATSHLGKRMPTIITICNYDEYQFAQPSANHLPTIKQPHYYRSTQDTLKDSDNPPSPQRGADDQGSSVSASKAQRSPYRQRDAFKLNPDADPEVVGIGYNPDGNLEVFNGTKVEMLKLVGGDEGQLQIDLLQIQGSNSVGPSMNPLMLKSKAMGALARIVNDRRDRDRRYQQARADNAANGRGPTRKTAPKFSVDDLPPTRDESEITRRFDVLLSESQGLKNALVKYGRENLFATFRDKQLEKAGMAR